MIELTEWLRGELLRCACTAAPEECCGLITRGAKGIALWPVENGHPEPRGAFAIPELRLLAVAEQATEREEQIVGLYHSHVEGDPTPSEADLEYAEAWPGLVWVIVAPQENGEGRFYSGLLA